MHIDIVGSTDLVRKNVVLAHQQIQSLYSRIRRICEHHNGIARELRGDAAVVTFTHPADAVDAALAMLCMHRLANTTRIGSISPQIRIGISHGPVFSDDWMITGEPVIRAQRLEQLAEAGKVLFDHPMFEQLDEKHLSIRKLGSRKLKGFPQTTEIYEASLHPVLACAGLVPGFAA